MELTPINQTSNLFTSSKSSSTQDFSSSSNSYTLSEMNSHKQSDIKMESPFSDIEEDELAFMQDMASILVTLKKAEATPQPKNNKNLKRKRFQRSRGSFSDLSEEAFDSDSVVDRKTDSMVLDETDSKFSTDIFGRKKAPSGTACEKHKKEKKRCPEDCPMRKNNQKHIESKLQEQKQQISDEENHPVFVTARQIVKMTEELIAQLHQDNWEGTSTKLFHFIASMKDCPSEVEKFEISEKEPKTKEECMEFIQSIMRQLNQISPKESAAPIIQEPPSPKVEESLPIEEEATVRKKRRAAVETPNYRYEMEIQESPKFKKSSPTKACEYHTTVHARCPPNCPDRRLVVKTQKHNSDASPQPTKEVVEASVSESEMETPVIDSPAPEKPRTPSLIKSTRKYVSVACERHKILHARCPANCPDRLAKDAQRMEEIQNGNGLVSEETTS